MRVEWRPCGMYYRVELTPPEEKTLGGIYLPEQDAWRGGDGLVTALGTGRPECPGRSLFQARVGERVLFERMDLEPGPNDLEGAVADADIVGIVTGNEWGVEPCGEWLLVRLDGRQEETQSGLVVPDRYRKRRRSGVILAWGPGRTVTRGPLAGLRLSCAELLDLPGGADLAGIRVYWKKVATLLFRPEREDWFLVRAGDLIAVEE